MKSHIKTIIHRTNIGTLHHMAGGCEFDRQLALFSCRLSVPVCLSVPEMLGSVCPRNFTLESFFFASIFFFSRGKQRNTFPLGQGHFPLWTETSPADGNCD